MRKLTEVEEARALMTEALEWSVMRWLKDKKHVRKVADSANEALWAMQKQVKASWSSELRAAYGELSGEEHKHKGTIGAEAKHLAKAVKEADDEAYRAHMDAEQTFDLAEKRMSTSMARDGAHKAILSWELYEKAIRKAETGIASSRVAS